VRPLEGRRLALQRLLDVGARALLGSAAIGLVRRAQGDGADLEQLRAVETEELLGLVVRVHEAPGVHVQHHDRLGGVVDQEAIACGALAHRLLGLAPLGDIAQAQHEHLAPRERRLADGDLSREALPVLAPCPELPPGQVQRGVAGARGEALQRLRDRLALGDGDLGDQQLDALSDDFRFGIAEHALAGGIEGAQRAVLLDREHDVLDVIEDDLQVLGALLARRVLERSRLVRHQAHGLGDAAPLGLDALVMLVHQAQQQPDVGSGGAGAQLELPQLCAQLRMQVRVALG